MTAKKRVTLRLSPADMTRLEHLTTQTGHDRSTVLRAALRAAAATSSLPNRGVFTVGSHTFPFDIALQTEEETP